MNMSGWDIIAITKQKVLNRELAKNDPISIKKTFQEKDIQINLELDFYTPQIYLQDEEDKKDENSCYSVDVQFSMGGQVKFNNLSPIVFSRSDTKVTVTSMLLKSEAELQQERDKKKYELIIDFKKKHVFKDIKGICSQIHDLLEPILIIIFNTFGDMGIEIPVASFDLSTLPEEYHKPLVPSKAYFMVIKDKDNVDNNELVILMKTNSAKPDEISSNELLLTEDYDFKVLLSNKILMEWLIRPSLIDAIKKQAKNPDSVESIIALQDLGNGMWGIKNNERIYLKQDYDPWIDTFECRIDPVLHQLYLYMDVQADVFAELNHIDTWVMSWQIFTVSKSKFYGESQHIGLLEVKNDCGKNVSMEVTDTILGFLLGMLPGIIMVIAHVYTEGEVPGLGNYFSDIGQYLVTWPNQQYVELEMIDLPGDLAMFMKVNPYQPDPNEYPQASFDINPNKGEINKYNKKVTVHITDNSTAGTLGGEITSRFWDYGDGHKSSKGEQTHVYTEAGAFHIRLIVTNTKGYKSRAANTVFIKGLAK